MTNALQETVATILATLAAWAWLGRDVTQYDQDTGECHTFVLDSLSDADLVAKVTCVTDSNVRDQLTVGDAIALAEEAELAKLGSRRN